MGKAVLEFVVLDTTKGAIRFQEVNPNGETLNTNNPRTTVGTLYLRRMAPALEGKAPDKLKVTIEW